MKKIIIILTILLSTIFSNVAFADMMIPGQDCHDYDKVCYDKCIKPLTNKEYEKYERYKKYKLENKEFKNSFKEIRDKLKKIAKEKHTLEYKKKLKEKLIKDLELKYDIKIRNENENFYYKKGRCIEKCCTKEIKYCTDNSCLCMLKGNTFAVCKYDSECKWNCTNGEKSPKNIDFKTFIYKKYLIYKTTGIIFIFLIIGIFIYKRKKSKKG